MTMTINGTEGFVFPDNTSQATAATGFGFKNRIINGAMMIDQRNAGASVTATDAYTLDRWEARENTDGAITVQQVSDAPAGFINSLKVTTTTADATLATDQLVRITQMVEGLNCADLAWGTASAATVTLSFWVKSSLTGTFGGSLMNSARNRDYPFTYTISSANTWEQKTVTIAGDTTGTWLTTNGTGMRVTFGLGVASNLSGTAGAWASSEIYSATGAVSVIGTLSATWQVTGVQLEKGSTATSFDYRPYGTELHLCQKYFWIEDNSVMLSSNSNGSSVSATYIFPVPMRTAPTVVNNFTNGNYNTTLSAGKFKFNQPYVADATKTGTLSTNVNTIVNKCIVYWYGATFSVQPVGMDVSSLPITFSAEL